LDSHEAEAVAPAQSRFAIQGLRSRTFGPASEEPYRRRTSDWFRLVIAVGIMVGLCFHQGHPTDSEIDLVRLVNGLPDDLQPVFDAIFAVGALWAVGAVVAAALIARRWRLARDLAIAGFVAWFLARLIGALVVDNDSIREGLNVVTRFGDASPSFPVTPVAVVVAVIAAASPFLTRPSRRFGRLLILLMAVGSLYLGLALPDAAFAAVVLGWGVGAAVHLVFGSPGGRPTRAQVGAALEELGVSAHDVELARLQPRGSTLMLAADDDGPLHVRVLGRDESDAQFMAKLWRFLLYKDGGPRVYMTRLEDVEHEAYTLLLAARSGARVPDVVVTGTAGPSAALLVDRRPTGTLLVDAEPTDVSDAVLQSIWQQVSQLHAANVAHGALNSNHIILVSGTATIVDFSDSSTANSERQAADVAELLVSTANIVGDDRAIAAAMRGIGSDALVAAVPLIQPGALSLDLRARGRHARKDLKKHLDPLRAAVVTATGVEEPPLQQLYRVNTTNLLMAVGTLIAVFALLSQVGDPEEFWNTISGANWGWLAIALTVSFLTNFATAFSLMGCVPMNLPLIRTAELQLSMSFANLAVPAVGGLASQVRFLQLQGIDMASAVAAGGLLADVGNIAAQVILFFIAVALSPTAIHTGDIPVDSVISVLLIIVVVIVLAVGLILAVPKLRNLVVPPVKSAATTIWQALRSPRRLALLFGGNMINAFMYAFVLDACIIAFGGSINYWTLLALNIFIGTIASLIPIPGGGTAVNSVGMTGALTAVGVSTDVAVAAVLANQLVSSFIPAVPGWFATKNLMNDGYL
jgi:undecaprenyl-diphosphatase